MDIIRRSIIPEKEKAWHNFIHPYFTKQASNVVHEYIKHFSKEGDTLLDPYCGTGVTAIEALTLKRKVITVDINPLACFITEQTVKQINIQQFKSAFAHLSDTVGNEIDIIDKTETHELFKEKIPFWYPKGIKMPSDADFKKVEELWTHKQLIGLSILFNEINKISDEEIRNQMKLVFSATIARVNVTYNLSMSRQTEGKKIKLGDGGSSVFAQYRYWKPKSITELPVWERFKDRFKRVCRAKEEWNRQTLGFSVAENFQIINGSVLELENHIDKNSIDYIYTDPPYGANIAYLDLSIMWNSWLGFKVSDKMRDEEVIEGGELQKSKENYEELFSKSFEQMGKVLKKDKWLSVVFAHKKLEFWNTIIESCEENGIAFKGSTFQQTNNSSVHYKKNVANVLCSQRVASFQKTFEKSIREKPDDYKQYVINEITNICKSHNGASLDEITNKVLDKLHNGTTDIVEFKKRGYTNIYKLLGDEDIFEFNENNGLYYVKGRKENEHDYNKEYYKNKDELKIFLTGILKSHKSVKLEQLHNDVLEVFNQDKTVPIKQKDFFELLQELALPNNKTGGWVIKPAIQQSFEFPEITTDIKKGGRLVKINSDGYSHSEIIYRLYLIGNYLGFNSWIGKREQSSASFNGIKFKTISLSTLGLTYDKKIQEKIEQIDLIWMDKYGVPRYAFEIEESTSIVSGLDRFISLLEVEHSISKNLCIVAPKSRRRKLAKVFYDSTYVGSPLYMENKVKFVFKEDVVRFYDKHIGSDFNEVDLKAIFSEVEK